jgi:hypothetical protein
MAAFSIPAMTVPQRRTYHSFRKGIPGADSLMRNPKAPGPAQDRRRKHIGFCLDVQSSHEFMTRSGIIAETAQHSTRHHPGTVFVNSSGGHAPVRCLDNDGDSLRPQHLLDNVSDLGGEAFLNL